MRSDPNRLPRHHRLTMHDKNITAAALPKKPHIVPDSSDAAQRVRSRHPLVLHAYTQEKTTVIVTKLEGLLVLEAKHAQVDK